MTSLHAFSDAVHLAMMTLNDLAARDGGASGPYARMSVSASTLAMGFMRWSTAV
jgi:hypothetical protein